MKARLLGFVYAVAGIALAIGLTFGAYVLAGGGEDSEIRPVAIRNKLAPRPSPTPDGRDISGPCDEAEHANDPRCAPGGEDRPSNNDDNSGPGGGTDDDNSGPGSGDHDNSGSDDDNSGSGSDDSGGDDNSGSGSGDSGGDDNSGSGSDNSGSGSDGSGDD